MLHEIQKILNIVYTLNKSQVKGFTYYGYELDPFLHATKLLTPSLQLGKGDALNLPNQTRLFS